MASIGDKFIIEINEKYSTGGCTNETGTPDLLYRIKGFNSLVFDDNGISKLKPYKEEEDINKESYRSGLNAGWSAAVRIWSFLVSHGEGDFANAFGCTSRAMRENIMPEEGIDMLRRHDERDKVFHVGDEVTDGEYYGVVTFVTGSYITVVMSDGSADEYCTSGWRKTGRRFTQLEDVLKMLNMNEL